MVLLLLLLHASRMRRVARWDSVTSAVNSAQVEPFFFISVLRVCTPSGLPLCISASFPCDFTELSVRPIKRVDVSSKILTGVSKSGLGFCFLRREGPVGGRMVTSKGGSVT